MITIAIIYSRAEAMVAAASLEAAGILAHIGGYNHASVAVNPVALGGFRITVPDWQYEDASKVLSDIDPDAPYFSKALQKAVLKVCGFWMLMQVTVGVFFAVIYGVFSFWGLVFLPFTVLVPVNPQSGSVYYLSETKPETA